MMEYRARDEMLDFAKRVIGGGADFESEAYPIGWRREDGSLAAVGVFFHFAAPIECEVAFAVEGRRWFDPGFAYAGMAYPFVQLGLERLTVDVSADNGPARALARFLGFVPEGRKRRINGAPDRLIYGLLRTECRWLAPMTRAA